MPKQPRTYSTFKNIMPTFLDIPRPEMDVREVGGWIKYPRKVPVYDRAISLGNPHECERQREEQQRRRPNSKAQRRNPPELYQQCGTQRLRDHFPGLAKMLQAEVRDASRGVLRQADSTCPSRSSCSDAGSSASLDSRRRYV